MSLKMQVNDFQQQRFYYTGPELPKLVPIAPALDKKMHIQQDVHQKKYNIKNQYCSGQTPSIVRRNARERNRVKQVNDGFNALRKKLPSAVVSALSSGSRRGSGKKLSKVDTLRMVVEYIRYLEQLVDTGEETERKDMPSESFDMSLSFDLDEGVFTEDVSPFSDSAPSPTNSDCSSGISAGYAAPVNDDNLMDFRWW